MSYKKSENISSTIKGNLFIIEQLLTFNFSEVKNVSWIGLLNTIMRVGKTVNVRYFFPEYSFEYSISSCWLDLGKM